MKLSRYLPRLVVAGVFAALWMPFPGAADNAAPPAKEPVRLATTTSTENSGLLGALLPRFRDATGRGACHCGGNGQGASHGADGDVDVVLVHAPAAEQAFVDAGYGDQRLPVMYNDFVIVGPHDDPAGLRGASSAGEALEVARTTSLFVSRGDDSGTQEGACAVAARRKGT